MTTKIDVSKLPIESWDITRLIPHPQNAKKHPDDKTKLLSKSIQRVGMANAIQVEPPIYADGEANPEPGLIIAGHGRRLAALDAAWAKVPVIVRHDLTKLECAALRIADNTTVSNDYDTELMKMEINLLGEGGFELDAIGFDDKQLQTMVDDFGELDNDIFVEDIGQAVETQKTENVAKAAEIDQSAAPIGDALGFKRVTVEQSRKIRELMDAAAGKFAGLNKSPAEILIAVLEDY
jgi:ParB-like chromosome segregation protein Spo0J